MRWMSLPLFIFCCLISARLVYQAPARQVSQSSSASGRDNEVEAHFRQITHQYLRWLPKTMRRAWLDYLGSMSRISHGLNASIESDNFALTNGPCFSDLAASFYGWLLEQDVAHYEKLLATYERRTLRQVHSLDDEAGRGIYADVPPGLVWQKVLDIANGDANLAVALLGLCGHDDAISLKPALLAGRAATDTYVKRAENQVNRFADLMREKARQTNRTDLKKELLEIAPSRDASDPEESRRLFCVSTSLLYLPKALGTDMDLPASLKQKIARLQAPTKGAQVLPAKGYHVLASAVTACKLKGQTATGVLALISNPAAAWLYRAKMISEKAEARWSFGGIDLNHIELNDVLQLQARARSVARSFTDEHQPTPEYAAFTADWRNRLADLIGLKMEDLNTRPAADVLRRIHSRIAELDAATLLRKWYHVIELPGVGRVRVPSDAERPESQMSINTPDGLPPVNWGTIHHDHCDEPEWSDARCTRALETLKTWEIDFEWSMEQHRLGALFAISNCATLPAEVTMERLACRALKRTSP